MVKIKLVLLRSPLRVRSLLCVQLTSKKRVLRFWEAIMSFSRLGLTRFVDANNYSVDQISK